MPGTERIYEYNCMRRENTAHILSCIECNGYYDIICDSTIFYPGGGGQPCDSGFIGDVPILSVSVLGQDVLHRTNRPLLVGSCQTQTIDWGRRLDLMQHHTAEHLVSGTALRLFHTNNIGFHLTTSSCFVDFDTELSVEDITVLEQEVNRIAQENHLINCCYPSSEELNCMEYRSKGDKIHGPIRIVEIEGGDICACCGTHLPSTGYIGLIKLLNRRRNKSGIRLTLVTGIRALEEFTLRQRQLDEISALLSAKLPDCADFTQRLLTENSSLKLEMERINNILTEAVLHCADLSIPVFVHHAQKMTPEQLRSFALVYLRRSDNICVVIAPAGGGTRYAIASSSRNIQDIIDLLHHHFGGKGGGRGQLLEGYLPAEAQDVMAFLSSGELNSALSDQDPISS